MKLRLGLCTQPLLGPAKGGGLAGGPQPHPVNKKNQQQQQQNQGTATKTTMQINSGNGDEVKEMDRFGNDVSGGSRGGARGAHPPPLIFRPN